MYCTYEHDYYHRVGSVDYRSYIKYVRTYIGIARTHPIYIQHRNNSNQLNLKFNNTVQCYDVVYDY